MRWSSRRTNSIIAATICGIFALVFLFFVRVLTIESYKKDITLKDIFPKRDLEQYVPGSYITPHTSRQEPALTETTPIDSSLTDGNVKLKMVYYIIVGSFGNLKQAQQESEKLINSLNTNIIILPPTKEIYFRISYGKYSSLEEAKATIISVKKTVKSDAWILSVRE